MTIHEFEKFLTSQLSLFVANAEKSEEWGHSVATKATWMRYFLAWAEWGTELHKDYWCP